MFGAKNSGILFGGNFFKVKKEGLYFTGTRPKRKKKFQEVPPKKLFSLLDQEGVFFRARGGHGSGGLPKIKNLICAPLHKKKKTSFSSPFHLKKTFVVGGGPFFFPMVSGLFF